MNAARGYFFDPERCEICDRRSGTHMTETGVFGEVWICEQCHWGEPDAKTPESLEKAAPRTETPPLVPAQSSDSSAAASEHAQDDTRAELIDTFDDIERYGEQFPEIDPQTGFEI